jgi:AcrR family transcriptional regulator
MGAKKKKGVHPNLSADRVRTTALSLIEEEGLAELSTRKLGRALGVEAMAIYWYYPSKDALLDAVVDLLIAKMNPRALLAEGDDWMNALRKLARAYRALAHEYPKAFPLLATRRFATAGTYAFLEELFAMAKKEGLDERTIARWFRLFSSYCSGVALDELAGRNEADAGGAPEELRARFPTLVAVSEWLAPSAYDEVFEFGLEVLLDRLAAKTGKKKSGTPKRRSR